MLWGTHKKNRNRQGVHKIRKIFYFQMLVKNWTFVKSYSWLLIASIEPRGIQELSNWTVLLLCIVWLEPLCNTILLCQCCKAFPTIINKYIYQKQGIIWRNFLAASYVVKRKSLQLPKDDFKPEKFFREMIHIMQITKIQALR